MNSGALATLATFSIAQLVASSTLTGCEGSQAHTILAEQFSQPSHFHDLQKGQNLLCSLEHGEDSRE